MSPESRRRKNQPQPPPFPSLKHATHQSTPLGSPPIARRERCRHEQIHATPSTQIRAAVASRRKWRKKKKKQPLLRLDPRQPPTFLLPWSPESRRKRSSRSPPPWSPESRRRRSSRSRSCPLDPRQPPPPLLFSVATSWKEKKQQQSERLEDFYLDLVEDNRKITPRDYLELALRPVQGGGMDLSAKNEIRESIRALFPDRECFTLVRPLSNENDLQRLDEIQGYVVALKESV